MHSRRSNVPDPAPQESVSPPFLSPSLNYAQIADEKRLSKNNLVQFFRTRASSPALFAAHGRSRDVHRPSLDMSRVR
jgi:hypothetical protein